VAVEALEVYGDKLFVGGAFTSAGGLPAQNLATWDGSIWMPIPGMPVLVRMLRVYDDLLYVGGFIKRVDGFPSRGVAVWRTPGVVTAPGPIRVEFGLSSSTCRVAGQSFSPDDVMGLLSGSDHLDVRQVQIPSLVLAGTVHPLSATVVRSTMASGSEECGCVPRQDAHDDLVMTFSRSAISALGVQEGSALTLAGILIDGTRLEAQACLETDEAGGAGERPSLVVSRSVVTEGDVETLLDVPVATKVHLTVYDVRGRLVRVLYDGPAPTGQFRVRWDTTDVAGRRVSRGVYLVRMTTRGRSLARRVIVLR
jgi:hypothetical protein